MCVCLVHFSENAENGKYRQHVTLLQILNCNYKLYTQHNKTLRMVCYSHFSAMCQMTQK